MKKLLAAVAVSLVIAAPVHPQMLESADDPAFVAALSALLAKDDHAAVAALRDLAEAGNPAALVALPLALQWVPPVGNLKEKNAQRKVGGVNALDAAANTHRATALWSAGQIDDALTLPDRATGLLALGEPEKAAVLLYAWLNQTGGRGDLPPDLMSDDLPAMLGAYALADRLRHAVHHSGQAHEEAARLLSLMREDRLSAWLAYVHLLETAPEAFDMVGNPLAGTGLSAADTETRLADARAVRAVWFGFASDDSPTSVDTAARAREVLLARTEFRPVTHLCQAHCPDSLATCETAMLVYASLPFGGIAHWQPFADMLSARAFAASDRGLAVLIPQRKDPAAAADRATAVALDACFGALLIRRDTLRFGP